MSDHDPQTQVRRLYALTEQLRAEVDRCHVEIADLRRGRRVPSKAPSEPVEATAGPPGPPEPPPAERLTERPESPDDATAPQDRRARYAERGYRWPPYTVDLAAARIAADIGGPTEEGWKDDPRNTAQAVLELFLDAGAVVAADAEQADLKAEVERLNEVLDRVMGVADVEEERLRAEVTFARLRAETGAERAQAEYEQLWEVVIVVRAQRDEARATIERVKTLADSWEHAPSRLTELASTRSAEGDDGLTRALAIGRAYATATRAALDAPPEPAPDLDPDDGSGLWLSTPLADPPPVDPLTASKARIEKVMKGMD